MLMGMVLSPAYAFTTGQAASLVIGQTTFNSGSPNGGGTTSQTGLDGPFGLVFDAAGNLWVTDVSNNRVLMFKPPFMNGMAASLVIGQTTFTNGLPNSGGTTSQTGLYFPFGLGFDASGNLWVADDGNNRVLGFKPPFSNGMAASLVIGQTDFVSNGQATTQTGLRSPEGLGFDAAGNLWVADINNDRVLMFKPPFANGMTASLVIGQTNFISIGPCAPTQTSLCNPSWVGFDASGNVWVSDFGNRRVLRFTPPFSNGMSASLVIGQANFVSNSFTTTQTGLSTPTGLGFDAAGNLWVSDSWTTPNGNNRVLMFKPPFSNGMAASLVIGQTDFVSGGAATTQTGLNNPRGLVFDALGNLWVSDASNNRGLMFAGSSGLSGFLLQLQPGWNLISLPLVPTQTAIAKLLLPLIQLHELVIVWGFTPPATWSFFNPGPPSSGTLTSMVDGKGYWVNVKDAVNMTVVGYIIQPASSPPSYSLAAGWNLVGFKPQPNVQNETVANYLASISGKYSSVWVYNNLNGQWITGVGGLQLAPGEGMWIYITAAPATLLP